MIKVSRTPSGRYIATGKTHQVEENDLLRAVGKALWLEGEVKLEVEGAVLPVSEMDQEQKELRETILSIEAQLGKETEDYLLFKLLGELDYWTFQWEQRYPGVQFER